MKAFLYESPLKNKKYRVVFFDKDDNKIKHTDFGAKNMSDFTIHKDTERKKRYLTRFKKLIQKDKDDFTKPITLATFLLWNKPTLRESWINYKKHFDLE